MTRESKLYPAQIQAQCQGATAILEKDNTNLELTSKAVAAFVNDTLIESVAFDQLKLQCENYIGIISSMKEINNSDIADYNTLSGAVGSEELIGEVILDNKEKYMRLRDEAYANEKTYKNLASQYWWISGLAAIYMAQASWYHILGEFYDWLYQQWQKKEEEYDNIEATTAGLFANSAATRAALGGMLSALQGAFKMDFGYIPEAVVPAKLQLECVMMGNPDTANGIKALDEYLVQSGKFTQEERTAIISNILDNAPEKVKDLAGITAINGNEAAEKIAGMVTAYMPKDVAEAIHSREVAAEVDRWIGVTDDVANAYLKNVYTYCKRTPEDEGYMTVDGREYYLLDGMVGPLAEIEVGDDCSSFVYACLIQAEYVSKENIQSWAPNSANYLPEGSMSTVLTDAGFVWHSKSELDAADIQKGDILVRNGHVEIFYEYDTEGNECAYTWGEVYTEEPKKKNVTRNTIWKVYEGVWRYEGN